MVLGWSRVFDAMDFMNLINCIVLSFISCVSSLLVACIFYTHVFILVSTGFVLCPLRFVGGFTLTLSQNQYC